MRHPQSCVLPIRPSSAVLDPRHQRRDGLFARCRLGNLRRAKESPGPTTSLAAVTGLHERLRQACILNRISPDTSHISQYSVAPSPSMRIAVAQRLGAAATADGNLGSRDRSGTNHNNSRCASGSLWYSKFLDKSTSAASCKRIEYSRRRTEVPVKDDRRGNDGFSPKPRITRPVTIYSYRLLNAHAHNSARS